MWAFQSRIQPWDSKFYFTGRQEMKFFRGLLVLSVLALILSGCGEDISEEEAQTLAASGGGWGKSFRRARGGSRGLCAPHVAFPDHHFPFRRRNVGANQYRFHLHFFRESPHAAVDFKQRISSFQPGQLRQRVLPGRNHSS